MDDDIGITSEIPYPAYVEEGLRSVIRRVLQDAADEGLPGEHHFFITFRTGADGVELSDSQRAQYPDEMTIVLQHQFWDLEIGEDDFQVTLSFNNTPERLRVPFAAITAFVDPAVSFGLQFQTEGALGTAGLSGEAARGEAVGDDAANVVTLDAFRKK